TSLAYTSPSTLAVGCSTTCSAPTSPDLRSAIVTRIAVTSAIDAGQPEPPNDVHHVVPDAWLFGSVAIDAGGASVYSSVTPAVAPCSSVEARATEPENALPRPSPT